MSVSACSFSMAARCLGCLCLVGAGAAWGPDGHAIVAHIAKEHLTAEAHSTMQTLFGDVNFTRASDWCDDFDHTPGGKWSGPLHFINYPGHSCNFSWVRDCANDQCVVGAISNFTGQLKSAGEVGYESGWMALSFVIHMMGDVHQPLHVASADDNGGNFIKVAGNRFSRDPQDWKMRNMTLHSQWDDDAVVRIIKDLEEESGLRAVEQAEPKKPFPVQYHKWWLLSGLLLSRLANSRWAQDASTWTLPVANPADDSVLRGGLAEVAMETAALGCEYAYEYPDGSRVQSGDVLERSYFERMRPVIEKQLAKAGMRLAAILNRLFGQGAMASEVYV